MLNSTNHQEGNANQNHKEITLLVSEWLSSKWQQLISVAEDVEKRALTCTVAKDVSQCSHYWKHYGGFWKHKKIKLPYELEIPRMVIYPKKTKQSKKLI